MDPANAAAVDPSLQPPGHEIFLTNYRLGKTLGIGSFGKVKLAEHILTGHKVAIKILNRKKIKQMDMEEKVRREIQILRLFMHPHIIRLYEVIETPNDIYVVMEYVKSGELFDYIVEKGRLMEDEARAFFQQIISGVEYCHRNMVVHRDLKPENLLLDSRMNVKIADFGLSNVMRDGHFLKTSCGSPNYAAPEVISGKLYAGPEVDVWSCGVILYALLCGSLPFDDENIPNLFKKIKGGIYNLPSHLSPGARDLIPRMLLVDPLKRITIPEIRQHPWFTLHLPRYLAVMQADTIINGGSVDEEVVAEVCRMGFEREALIESIRRREQNKATVAYYLVYDNRRRFNSSGYLNAELSEQTPHPSGMMGGPFVQGRPVPLAPPAPAAPAGAAGAGGAASLLGGGATAPGVPQQRLVAERKWQQGVKARGHPAAIMAEVLRALQALGIPWKRIGPYNIKLRLELHPPPRGLGSPGGGGDKGDAMAVDGGSEDEDDGMEEGGLHSHASRSLSHPSVGQVGHGVAPPGTPSSSVLGGHRGGPGGEGRDRGDGTRVYEPGVVKAELMLYKARTDEYVLDVQNLGGDLFVFFDFSAALLQELRL